MTVLSADPRQPLFIQFFSHHTAPRFFGIPLLDQPRVVRISRTTGTILAFIVGHPSFGGLDFGFGRRLPHLLVRQQLKPFLEIHHVRHRPTLHLAPTSGRGAFAFASRGHSASTSATHGFGTMEGRFPGFISFYGRRPRPRARPRPRPRRGGGGPEVRVEVRRTDGLPPSSYTVVTVLVCVMLRIRLPRARSCASSFSKSNRRRKPRPRSSSSSSSSSSDGGEESGDGGEGTRGRRRGCLAATVGRPVGVVTVEVVVLVPAPALRRAVEGREGAVVVVAVVTGRGLGCLELAVVVVAVGRVRVEVTGRVWVAVVVGAVVTEGGGGGGGAVVVAGVVPVPATGGKVKAFKASSTLTG